MRLGFQDALRAALPAAELNLLHVSELAVVKVGNADHGWFSFDSPGPPDLSCFTDLAVAPGALAPHGLKGFSFYLGLEGGAFVDYQGHEGSHEFVRFAPASAFDAEQARPERLRRQLPDVGSQLLLLDFRTPRLLRPTIDTVGGLFLQGTVVFSPVPATGPVSSIVRPKTVVLPRPLACELCGAVVFDPSEKILLDAHVQHKSCLAELALLHGDRFCSVMGNASGSCGLPLPIKELVAAVLPYLQQIMAEPSVKETLASEIFRPIKARISERLQHLLEHDPPAILDFDPSVPWHKFQHNERTGVEGVADPWDAEWAQQAGFNVSHVRYETCLTFTHLRRAHISLHACTSQALWLLGHPVGQDMPEPFDDVTQIRLDADKPFPYLHGCDGSHRDSSSWRSRRGNHRAEPYLVATRQCHQAPVGFKGLSLERRSHLCQLTCRAPAPIPAPARS